MTARGRAKPIIPDALSRSANALGMLAGETAAAMRIVPAAVFAPENDVGTESSQTRRWSEWDSNPRSPS
jgi:hypothetical protein